MFANKYLHKNNRIPLLEVKPEKDTGIIVVIPCFREPDILLTLNSLNKCYSPQQKVEVIVLLNHSETAPYETKEYNNLTYEKVEKWISEQESKRFGFYVIYPVELPKKWAGVGLARKSGMDEALLRFNLLNKPNGIIVSLDADTLVGKNYLVEIEKHFRENPTHVGATIAFQHQTDGLEEKQLKGIQLYEKYLLYYRNALEYIGYPSPMFTIGSAFAVTSNAYIKRGGMTRRQAGEDFYFLQTLAQIGTVGEITTTMVYPSARTSDRIPFGTGPAIAKWMNGEMDLTLTYNFQAFVDLKKYFDFTEQLYQVDENTYLKLVFTLPEPVTQFLLKDNFWKELEELNKNCSTIKSFMLRYFHRFNAFRILKFMNFSHDQFYEKADLDIQFERLEKEIN